jgi:hypothetical protein
MSKAKVLKKLKADNAEFSDGFDSTSYYFFEAWLPQGKIWDNAHQTGSIYVSKDSKETFASFWKYVLYQIEGKVKDETK